MSNPKAISNTLKKHFSTVGQRLASRFSTSITEHDFRDYLDPPLQNSFYFDPFVPQEIESEIKALPNNKAHGLYSCPVNIVKLAGHVISQHLCSMFNLSVLSGSFPSKLKIAKVIPIFKGGDESNPENYRPISLLSIFNRIFEKLMYKRLTKFIDKHALLYSSQYGFRKWHNTQQAVLDILNDIHTNNLRVAYSLTRRRHLALLTTTPF